jgi:hypothetical protein
VLLDILSFFLSSFTSFYYFFFHIHEAHILYYFSWVDRVGKRSIINTTVTGIGGGLLLYEHGRSMDGVVFEQHCEALGDWDY